MKKSATELWAVLDEKGNILYSRGGSSSTKKLLIYTSESKANAVANNVYIKQILPEKYSIKCIYKNTEDLVLPHTIKIY